MEDSKLISTILKKKKLQKISQESLGFIIPGSWIRAMDWDRQTIFVMEFHPLSKSMIIKEIGNEEISNPEPS